MKNERARVICRWHVLVHLSIVATYALYEGQRNSVFLNGEALNDYNLVTHGLTYAVSYASSFWSTLFGKRSGSSDHTVNTSTIWRWVSQRKSSVFLRCKALFESSIKNHNPWEINSVSGYDLGYCFCAVLASLQCIFSCNYKLSAGWSGEQEQKRL